MPQGKNEKANKLARLTSLTKESLVPKIFVESLPKLCIEIEEGKEVNMATPEPSPYRLTKS